MSGSVSQSVSNVFRFWRFCRIYSTELVSPSLSASVKQYDLVSQDRATRKWFQCYGWCTQQWLIIRHASFSQQPHSLFSNPCLTNLTAALGLPLPQNRLASSVLLVVCRSRSLSCPKFVGTWLVTTFSPSDLEASLLQQLSNGQVRKQLPGQVTGLLQKTAQCSYEICSPTGKSTGEKSSAI